MFETLRGPHDRLPTKLAKAGRQARILGSTCLIPCPLRMLLRELRRDELDALLAIADSIGGSGPYRHEGLGAPDPPIRRLLEPFLYMSHEPSQLFDVRVRMQITSRLRATDAAAFGELVSALETERTRRE